MDNAINVSVKYLNAQDARIEISLDCRRAEMLIDGHQTITDNVFSQVSKALSVVDQIHGMDWGIQASKSKTPIDTETGGNGDG